MGTREKQELKVDGSGGQMHDLWAQCDIHICSHNCFGQIGNKDITKDESAPLEAIAKLRLLGTFRKRIFRVYKRKIAALNIYSYDKKDQNEFQVAHIREQYRIVETNAIYQGT